MNAKANIHQLKERLQTAWGEERLPDNFIEEFFAIVAEGLQQDGLVTVKGLGEFRVDPADPANPVVFTPAPQLAEDVNAPFAFFRPEPILQQSAPQPTPELELKPEPQPEPVVSESESQIEPMPEADDSIAQSIAEAAIAQALAEAEEEAAQVAAQAEAEAAAVAAALHPRSRREAHPDQTESRPHRLVQPQRPHIPHLDPLPEPSRSPQPQQLQAYSPGMSTFKPQPIPIDPEPEQPAEPDYYYHDDASGHRYTWLWILLTALISLAVGFACGYIFAASDETSDTDPLPHEAVETVTNPQPTDEADAIALGESMEPETAVVTETVRQGYYFTHMARKHYGDKAFWPYIYIENEAKLGRPEHTAAGVVLVIPPASKYDIDPADPASIARAKQLARDIYARFQ